MTNEVSHGVMIPLIGGLTIGAMNVLKKDPEFILSHPCFHKNDNQFLCNYPHFREKYIVINEDGTFFTEEEENKFNNTKNVDIVTSVCPCAGLSLLNSSMSNNKVKNSCMSRGSDAIQNRFMYSVSEFVLGKISPKVFLFENAPNLFTNAGKGVFERLIEIAKNYGYSMSLYKTSTHLHGIPQKRERTFCFFWKSEHAPVLPWISKPCKNLSEYLKEIPKYASMNDIEAYRKAFDENNMVKFVRKTGVSFEEMYDNHFRSLHGYAISGGRFDECIEFLESLGDERQVRLLKYEKSKIDAGKRYWDSSPNICREITHSIISKNMMRTVLADEQRFLTPREHMYLMGLPHHFEVSEKDLYLITQNVPVNTAADMIELAKKFVEDGLVYSSGHKFLKQNNLSKTVSAVNSGSESEKTSFCKFLK